MDCGKERKVRERSWERMEKTTRQLRSVDVEQVMKSRCQMMIVIRRKEKKEKKTNPKKAGS